MLKTDRLKSLVVLIVAGFMGGAVSRTVLDMIPKASAQQEKAEQVVRAHSFELVDNGGYTRARLDVEQTDPRKGIPFDRTRLLFFDKGRNVAVELTGGDGFGSYLSLTRLPKGNGILLNTNSDEMLTARKGEKVVWSAP